MHTHQKADVEAHLGHDGRVYVLDLSRTFPPQAPDVCHHLPAPPGSIFFRMFRPEFLQQLKQQGRPALSSDAMSGFAHREDAAMHNQQVREATTELLQRVIPEFARQLEEEVKGEEMKEQKQEQQEDQEEQEEQDGEEENRQKESREIKQEQHGRDGGRGSLALREPISEVLHSRGINIRHAGLLRSLLSNQKSANGVTLLVEMLARTLKNMLREWLRDTTPLKTNTYNSNAAAAGGAGALVDEDEAQSQSQSEFFNKTKTVEFLNLIAGSGSDDSSTSRSFWQDQVLPNLCARFGSVALTVEEQANLFEAVTKMNAADHGDVLTRSTMHMLQMLGISLTSTCLKDLQGRAASSSTSPSPSPIATSGGSVGGFKFATSDLQESQVRVKYMNLMDYALAKMYAAQAESIRQVQAQVKARLRVSHSQSTFFHSSQPNLHSF
jgi:hypothetical protein